MTTVLLLGVGPRPSPKARKIYAPGLRLQSIGEALAAQGHTVHVAELAFGSESDEASQPPTDSPFASQTLLSSNPEQRRIELETLLGKTSPDCVVTSTDVMGNLAANSSFSGPLYCDFFGHPMAERQMQATVAKSNAGLEDQWRMILPILLRADCFGVCSNAQRHAIFGELGAVGRLGFETATHNFAHVLSPANPFDQPFKKNAYSCKGRVIPTEAQMLLFSGGYNTWLDEETLFNSVELALVQEPNLHYVSTGGGIEGHVTEVFSRFKARVDASPNRDRFHFVGWLEHDDYLSLCLEAEAGIIVDEPTLEGVYGCRNRLFSWIWAGMHALATDLSESTREVLVPNGWVVPLPLKDPVKIAEIILREVRLGRYKDEELRQRQAKLNQICSPKRCYKELIQWVADPKPAPDRTASSSLKESFHHYQALPEMLELISSLKGSRAFSLFLATQGDKRLLFERVCTLIEHSKREPKR